MAIITQAQARIALPGLTADQADVATLIDRADSVLAAWCGYEAPTESSNPTFQDVAYVRYLPGPGGRSLCLPVWPIVSVTAIEDDPTEVFDGTSYLVASGDYDIRPRGEVLLKQASVHGAWTDTSARTIKATWVAGYATPPEDLTQAVVEYVALLWASRRTLGVGGISTGDGSVQTRDPTVPEHVRQKLQRFNLREWSSRGVIP